MPAPSSTVTRRAPRDATLRLRRLAHATSRAWGRFDRRERGWTQPPHLTAPRLVHQAARLAARLHDEYEFERLALANP